MKKTLLAAALLVGFAGAGVAQAETSVTLYGILDTGYGYQNYKWDKDLGSYYDRESETWRSLDATVRSRSSGLRSGTVNGNRWGLKGSEDLGDGLRAIFQLEQGFDIGSGYGSSSRAFHRQAFVGLSSDNWGTFTMGRQYSAGVEVGNLIANGWNMGDVDKVFGGVGYANRIDNSFKYTTPDLSGFKLVALYGDGGESTVQRGDINGYEFDELRQDRAPRVSVGLMYANGPISAGASYDRQAQYGNDVYGSELDAATSWNINAAYDFEVVKLSLAYGQDRHGKLGWGGPVGNYIDLSGLPSSAPAWAKSGNTSALFNDFKSNNYHVGLSAPIGGGTLYAGWNYSTSNLDDGDKLDNFAGNISTYQINYFYPLSKRTAVYAYGTYGRNLGYIDNLKGTEAGLGLNHKF